MSHEQLEMQDAIAVGEAIEANRKASHRELAKICRVGKNRITKLARIAGWHQPYLSTTKMPDTWQRIEAE
jgi:hypothetical protein